jgi:cytochrome P450
MVSLRPGALPCDEVTAGDELARGLLAPETIADPYGLYRELRQAEPVVMSNGTILWSTYRSCDTLLREPHASNDRMNSTLYRCPIGGGAEPLKPEVQSFMFMDPPEHTVFRRLASAALNAAAISDLTAFVEEFIDDALADVGDAPFDIIERLAFPLPVSVICRVLGVHLADRGWLQQRTALMAKALDPWVAILGRPAPGYEARQRAEEETNAYLTDLVAERRRRPSADLVSNLIAHQKSRALNDREIAMTCRVMLNAGHETTVNLLGNLVKVLHDRPNLLDEIRATEGLSDAVVEETLRFEPPVQLVQRHAAETFDVHGYEIPAGTANLVLIGAAHRDPVRFPNPDHFDPARPANRHLAFAGGRHFCIGARLARLEATTLAQRLAQTVDTITIEPGGERFKAQIALRGAERLMVRLHHRPQQPHRPATRTPLERASR